MPRASIRLAGAEPDHLVEAVVFTAGPADVRDVMVAGRWIVQDHRHLQVAVREELAASIAEVWEVA